MRQAGYLHTRMKRPSRKERSLPSGSADCQRCYRPKIFLVTTPPGSTRTTRSGSVTSRKTGSSTLRMHAALMRQRNNQTSPNEGIVYHWQHFDGLRVAFVRDPVDRFVSSYMEIRTPPRGYKPHYDDIQQDFDEFFIRYLEGKYRDGRYTIKNHFGAQTAHLVHHNGDGIIFDYIGRAEHLNREWNTSLRSFLPFRIPDLPEKRVRATTVVKPVMSPDQIRHVCRLYCHDFCCLGMDFPPECTNSTGREKLDVCPCQSKRPPLYPWHTSS